MLVHLEVAAAASPRARSRRVCRAARACDRRSRFPSPRALRFAVEVDVHLDVRLARLALNARRARAVDERVGDAEPDAVRAGAAGLALGVRREPRSTKPRRPMFAANSRSAGAVPTTAESPRSMPSGAEVARARDRARAPAAAGRGRRVVAAQQSRRSAAPCGREQRFDERIELGRRRPRRVRRPARRSSTTSSYPAPARRSRAGSRQARGAAHRRDDAACRPPSHRAGRRRGPREYDLSRHRTASEPEAPAPASARSAGGGGTAPPRRAP